MKRYILDEVETFEQATKVPNSDMVYFIHEEGEIISTARRNRGYGKYAKLTVLEGSPEKIAEQMMKLAVEVGK